MIEEEDETYKHCKYWRNSKVWEDEKANVGRCERFTHQGEEIKVIKDLRHSGLENNAFLFASSNTPKVGILTKRNFGCTLFEMSLGRKAELTMV
jgi:hypothetical protein